MSRRLLVAFLAGDQANKGDRSSTIRSRCSSASNRNGPRYIPLSAAANERMHGAFSPSSSGRARRSPFVSTNGRPENTADNPTDPGCGARGHRAMNGPPRKCRPPAAAGTTPCDQRGAADSVETRGPHPRSPTAPSLRTSAEFCANARELLEAHGFALGQRGRHCCAAAVSHIGHKSSHSHRYTGKDRNLQVLADVNRGRQVNHHFVTRIEIVPVT